MARTNRRELFVVALVSSVTTALLLGGGVAVALSVPNNSVNSAKIVNNTVSSTDIRNATITDLDLARGARTYWAVVTFTSGLPALTADQGVSSVLDVGLGSSSLIWNVEIDNCAVHATMHSNTPDTAANGFVITSEQFNTGPNDGLFIQTRTLGGAFADPNNGTGYSVTVNC